MPIRSLENSPPLVRRWVRWVLVTCLVPTLLIASLAEYFTVWSALTGYWGPEWPNVENDAFVMTAIWIALVLALALVVQRPLRLWWRRRT